MAGGLACRAAVELCLRGFFGSWARLGLGSLREPLKYSATAARHGSPTAAGGAPAPVGQRRLFGCARASPGMSRGPPAGLQGTQGGPQARHGSMYTIYTKNQ